MMDRNSKYQVFDLDSAGGVINIGERMRQKLEAIPLPDLNGKRVLDVGCDHGFWSFLAANRGAKQVLGLDRGRPIDGQYFNLARSNTEIAGQYPAFKNVHFESIDLGAQWHEFGLYDVIFMFSLYHHVYNSAGGDHDSIWFWLWRHCALGAVLLWENPTDCLDSVAAAHINKPLQANFTKEKILEAAGKYFEIEYIGNAKHESTRVVYRFVPKQREMKTFTAKMVNGAGGASKAFSHENSRRSHEVNSALGFFPYAGWLNLELSEPFEWGRHFYKTPILDVLTRSEGFDSPWGLRWARFYPVKVNGVGGLVMRFDGEEYPQNFVEVLAATNLRATAVGDTVTLSLESC